MSPTEAMYVVERIEKSWCLSERDLTDAECILADQLEAVRTAKRANAELNHAMCPKCRDLLTAHKLRVVPAT